jgi:hypothetical protein
MESPDFNPIAMVKEAQQPTLKIKNIETVLGDLEVMFRLFYGLFDKVILLPVLVQMLSELIKKEQKTNRCL